ncbi:MAG: ArsC family reductase [Gammaproteobacteria bacterium]|nr:ArsC family reductase [Gammaproteobacteria bacterium]MCF6363349.1 ArsC family reductase [Gammaproteobacteria bacterium]
MTILYGIKNCDSVRKARQWLAANDILYTFHDLRADGQDEATLHAWAESVGWETLLNRRGTTWRKLPEEQRNVIDEQKAIQLMLDNPTLIKRPVLVSDDGQAHVGFKPTDYETIFQQG